MEVRVELEVGDELGRMRGWDVESHIKVSYQEGAEGGPIFQVRQTK